MQTIPAAPKFHAFNTGRLYSREGQRIGWTVLSPGRVAMIDIDRHIEYVLALHEISDSPLRNSDVLRAYDTHDGSMRGTHTEEFQAVRSQLRAAAEAVGGVK